MSNEKEIKLTPTEWGILEHRLSLDDCLAEVLTSGEYPESEFDAIQEKARNLYGKINQTRTINFAELDEQEIEILVDCLDGSTFFASAEDAVASGEITKGKLNHQIKSAESLVAKFKACGFPARIPLA